MPGPVLLVHDDIAVIAGVRRLLSREGHEVILATSVADAIIAFGHYLPSLAIVAPSVEGQRGAALLEELKRHPDAAVAKIVLLGESVPGASLPVVPLPLDGATFMEIVREALHTEGAPDAWQVIPGAALPVATQEESSQEEWRVAVAPLERALFGDLTPTRELASPFVPLDLPEDQMAGMVVQAAAVEDAEEPPEPAPEEPAQFTELSAEVEAEVPADEPLFATPRFYEPPLDSTDEPPGDFPADSPEELPVEAVAPDSPGELPAEAVAPEVPLEPAPEPEPPALEEPAPSLEAILAPVLSTPPVPPPAPLVELAFDFPPPAAISLAPPESLTPAPPRFLEKLPRLLPLPANGHLTSSRLPVFLASLSDAPHITSVMVVGPRSQRTFWVQGERVLAADSQVPQESLVDQARRDGLIDERQEAHLQPLRFGPPAAVLRELKEQGFLRASEAQPLLERQVDAVTIAALIETDSTYELRLADHLPKEVVGVSRPMAPILAGALRRSLDVDMDAPYTQAGGWLEPGDSWEMREEFAPTEAERRLFRRVDSKRKLGQMLAGGEETPELIARTLHWAIPLGVLRLHPAAVESQDPAAVVARLAAKWAEVQEADYFTALGLPRQANREEVQRAFDAMLNQFGPARYVGHPDTAVLMKAQQVQAALREAAQVLSDDRLRAAYARNLLD